MAFKILSIFIIIMAITTPNNASSADDLVHNILEAADQRNSEADIFNRVLSSNNYQHQRQALLALGRIGDGSAVLKISPFLFSKQPNVRAMAAFALGITSKPSAHKLLVLGLKSEQHPVVIGRLLVAIGNIADPKGAIASILPFLNHKNDDVKASACDGLTSAWSFNRETVSIPNSTQVNRLLELISLSENSEPLTSHCLYTLSRLRTDTKIFDIKKLQTIYKTLSSTDAKVLTIRIMAAQKNEIFLDNFLVASESDHPMSIRAEAATAIASLEYQEKLLAPMIKIASDASSHVKVNLIDNLELTSDNHDLLDIINILSNDKSEWVRHRAILKLFSVNGSKMGVRFLTLLNSPNFQPQQLALDILRTYTLPKHDEYLQILADSKHKGIASIATRLINDEDPDSEEVVAAHKSVSAQEALAVANKRLKVSTSRGNIVIQLLPSAAFTSASFYQLALTGYYDDLTFHRVIANFVAQGGDPESTGQGGPGFSIREELYPVEHQKGTVGIATSGKDTGGSQFFFNTAKNIHLNSHYTIFARIVEGLEVSESLEVGDKILSIKEIE